MASACIGDFLQEVFINDDVQTSQGSVRQPQPAAQGNVPKYVVPGTFSKVYGGHIDTWRSLGSRLVAVSGRMPHRESFQDVGPCSDERGLGPDPSTHSQAVSGRRLDAGESRAAMPSSEARSHGAAGFPGKINSHFRQRITTPALRFHLLLISFGTGLLDATTYSDFGIFASNQTGNTIIVLVEAIDRSAELPAPLLAVGISLTSFLFFGVLFGQIGVSRFVGPCTRGWLLFSTFIQAAFLFVAALLVELDVLTTQRRSPRDTTLLILLLASSSGIQVAMAKSVGVKEVPTAMLTSPLIDLLTDPGLMKMSLTSSDVVSRNLRLGYVLFFATGTVVGAIAKIYSGTKTVLWTSFALRVGNDLYIVLAPGEAMENDDDNVVNKGNGASGI